MTNVGEKEHKHFGKNRDPKDQGENASFLFRCRIMLKAGLQYNSAAKQKQDILSLISSTRLPQQSLQPRQGCCGNMTLPHTPELTGLLQTLPNASGGAVTV